MKSTERQKTMQLWLLHLISMHYTCSATVPPSDLHFNLSGCADRVGLICPPGCYSSRWSHLWTGAAASWSITVPSPRSHFIDKPLKRLHAQRCERINAALMFSISPAAVYNPHGLVELPSAPLEHLTLWSWGGADNQTQSNGLITKSAQWDKQQAEQRRHSRHHLLVHTQLRSFSSHSCSTQ